MVAHPEMRYLNLRWTFWISRWRVKIFLYVLCYKILIQSCFLFLCLCFHIPNISLNWRASFIHFWNLKWKDVGIMAWMERLKHQFIFLGIVKPQIIKCSCCDYLISLIISQFYVEDRNRNVIKSTFRGFFFLVVIKCFHFASLEIIQPPFGLKEAISKNLQTIS